MDASSLPTPEDFLCGQLAFLRRRAKDAEKANIDWWKAQIEEIAKRAPKPATAPLHPDHPRAA